MDWQLIWLDIQELALEFYNFTMTQGENNFRLVNDLQHEAGFFYQTSFVVMVLLAIFASDSFLWAHPIEEIKQWGKKISIIKVVVFSATIFSIHTFYKMLVYFTGSLIQAEASIMALDCLGSYINPISLMIYAYAVSIMNLQKKNVQAAFLGWSIFLTPGVMSFDGFLTEEDFIIYTVAGVIGLTGGILYRRFSPYITCFILYIIYFIAKFFMIYFSGELILLTAKTWFGKIAQYLACMQIDIMISLILLLGLFGYRMATTKGLKLRRELIYSLIIAVIMITSIVSGRTVTVEAIEVVKPDPWFYQEEETEGVEEGMPEENVGDNISFKVIVDTGNIRTGPSTDYEIITTVELDLVLYGTGNEELTDSGRIWYEIYLDEELTQTGWASEKIIQKQ